MVAFLVLHNPGIDTALIGTQCRIKKDSDKRFPVPDIITHEPPGRTEFYEIKPNSASGIDKGIDKILWFEPICDSELMPYIAGRQYDPDVRILLFGGSAMGNPVRITLHFKRDRPGLLLYDFCVDVSAESVSEALFVDLMLLLMALLLLFSRGLVPAPALALVTSPMRGSTGFGGANDVNDVGYVQALLNDWRDRNNLPLIGVDGASGPQTVAAIRDFQAASTGVVDGRFDPDGAGITALEQDHLGAMAVNAAPAALALAEAGGIPVEWQPLFETPDEAEEPIADVTSVDLDDAMRSALQDYLNRLHDTARELG
jgi:Putative peptidoglycan binding domain